MLSVSATTPWPANAASPWIEDRQHLLARGVAAGVLERARHPLDDRVHRLEVAGVGGHRDVQRLAVGAGEGAGGAEVVLDVAGPLAGERVEVALELAEDLLVALAEDVGEHVEAAAVGHPERRPRRCRPPPRRRAGGRASGSAISSALEREALVADVLGVQEALERLGGVEHRQGAALAPARRATPRGSAPSTRFWIHAFWSGSWMNMYSTPSVPQ